jgi:hypothetical protein
MGARVPKLTAPTMIQGPSISAENAISIRRVTRTWTISLRAATSAGLGFILVSLIPFQHCA